MLRRVCGLPAAVWTVVAFAVAVVGLSLLPLPEQVKANDDAQERGQSAETAYAKTLTVGLGDGVTMEFVLIRAGRFTMGSPKEEKGHEDDEQLHEVAITKPFYLGSYTVTRGQFRTFVDDTGHKTDAETDGQGGYGYDADKGEFQQDPKYSWRNPGFEQTDAHPVVNVSWNDAQAFCVWLSRKAGKKYRLPTEAQWEYACRGRTQTRFYFGDDDEDLAKYGNVADASARKKFPAWSWTIKADDGYVFTAPVGHYKPNGFGLYDMHGNVWQWCADYYDTQYYAHSPIKDPFNSKIPDSARRVLRGGSWCLNPTYCRAANRGRCAPDYRSDSDGFRVCLSLD
jgi:formylglycine-generating enzyme